LASLQANEITFTSSPSVFSPRPGGPRNSVNYLSQSKTSVDDDNDDDDDTYRFTGPLRQAHGQEPKCLQTLVVDAAMQADIGSRRFGSWM